MTFDAGAVFSQAEQLIGEAFVAAETTSNADVGRLLAQSLATQGFAALMPLVSAGDADDVGIDRARLLRAGAAALTLGALTGEHTVAWFDAVFDEALDDPQLVPELSAAVRAVGRAAPNVLYRMLVVIDRDVMPDDMEVDAQCVASGLIGVSERRDVEVARQPVLNRGFEPVPYRLRVAELILAHALREFRAVSNGQDDVTGSGRPSSRVADTALLLVLGLRDADNVDRGHALLIAADAIGLGAESDGHDLGAFLDEVVPAVVAEAAAGKSWSRDTRFPLYDAARAVADAYQEVEPFVELAAIRLLEDVAARTRRLGVSHDRNDQQEPSRTLDPPLVHNVMDAATSLMGAAWHGDPVAVGNLRGELVKRDDLRFRTEVLLRSLRGLALSHTAHVLSERAGLLPHEDGRDAFPLEAMATAVAERYPDGERGMRNLAGAFGLAGMVGEATLVYLGLAESGRIAPGNRTYVERAADLALDAAVTWAQPDSEASTTDLDVALALARELAGQLPDPTERQARLAIVRSIADRAVRSGIETGSERSH